MMIIRKSWKTVLLGLGLVFVASPRVHADLLINGDLDVTYQQEIVPGFFNPKPYAWVNTGTRAVSGPYEDEMSSESWAGPAPTPVTTHGFNVTTQVANNMDWAVFWHPFSGGGANGAATGHLYQDRPAQAGVTYTATGWFGAEANALMADAQFAIEFLNGSSVIIGTSSTSLMPTLFVANGQPFNYKKTTISGLAPVGTVTVRVRISMVGATSNPAGGGQAFVCDDITLWPSRIDHTTAVVGPGSTVGPSTSADAYSMSANDVRWNIRPGAVLVASADPVKAQLSFFLPNPTVTTMFVTVESRANTSGIRQKVEVKQGAGSGFTNLETFTPLPTGASVDRSVTLAVPSPNTHIDVGAGNKVVVQLLAKNTTAVLVYPWQYQVDVCYLDITP